MNSSPAIKRVIEITDKMIGVGAADTASLDNPTNPVGFALALEHALLAGGYAVKIPAWIERAP